MAKKSAQPAGTEGRRTASRKDRPPASSGRQGARKSQTPGSSDRRKSPRKTSAGSSKDRSKGPERLVEFQGRHLQLVSISGWECCERVNASGVVAIVAITKDRKLLLTEQFRPPVGRRCIELPAGLAGDVAGSEAESLAVAAQRELLEETGYSAGRMELLIQGPSSAGLTSEIITFFQALDVKPVHSGGGDSTEQITVHAVPLDKLRSWLADRESDGLLIDFKIPAGLFLAGVAPSR